MCAKKNGIYYAYNVSEVFTIVFSQSCSYKYSFECLRITYFSIARSVVQSEKWYGSSVLRRTPDSKIEFFFLLFLFRKIVSYTLRRVYRSLRLCGCYRNKHAVVQHSRSRDRVRRSSGFTVTSSTGTTIRRYNILFLRFVSYLIMS